MTARSGSILALVLIAIATTSTAASAQSSGFAVNRFEPAEHGSRQFVGDPLDLRAGTAAAGATFDYAYKPLVVYDASGAERYALVRHQAIVHAGGSVVLGDRLRLALDVPVAIYQDGESAVVGGELLAPASAPAFGDVRLAADVRVAGGLLTGPFTLALGVRGWLPTGLRSQFTSDGSARIAPQVLASGSASVFVWSARLALVYRSRDDAYAGRQLGSELFGAVGAGVRTKDGRLLVGPELFAASAFTGGAKLFGASETPIEWLFGAHYDVLKSLRAGAGIGGGIGRGFGAPVVRALASLEWVMSAPPDKIAAGEPPEPSTPWEGSDGTATTVPEKPLARVTENEIHIEEELRFATDSAELLEGSDAVLAAVKRILDEHPEIRRVRIEGHTDSVGDPAYNDDLSARRAASVEAWLVRHGVTKERLESAGLGSKEPIDTNDTEAGRAKNRRVVFRIVASP